MSLTKSLLLTSFILLTGCSMFQSKTVIETKTIEKEVPIVARPAPLDLSKVKFKVVTKKNLDEFLEELEREEVYIVLTVKDYEILSTNTGDLKQYILEQQRIIVYYEESLTN